MCRKALEGLCTDQGATAGSLAGSLQQLRDNGHIDPRLFEWADELRVVGNEAAHGVGLRLDRQDAEDTFDFTRAILDYVYVFKAKWEAFRRRRSSET